MKANELRLGNLVYYKDFYDRIDIWRINLIEEGRTDKFFPIAINHEWVAKMGFDKKQKLRNEYFEKDGFCLFYDIKGFYLYIDVDFEYGYVEHVHELQNLYFSLTGKELEIKE